MTAYRLPAGAVLIDGRHLDALRYAVDVAQRARRRNGLPPAAALEALAALVAPVAATGQSDSPDGAVGEADDMTTHEAAALLGCSTRTATRLAPKLGGRRIGGRWLVDRLAVAEHMEGRNA